MNMNLNLGPWTKIGIIILCICIFDILVVLLTSQNPLWAGRPMKVVLSDILFLEGATTCGIGALIAVGYTAQRIETPSTLYASPGGQAEYLRQERPRQISFGIILMIIGAVLIVLSIVAYLLI